MTATICAISVIVLYIGVSIAALYGYVMNIITLMGQVSGNIFTLLEMARCIGVIFPPLGIVLGFV